MEKARVLWKSSRSIGLGYIKLMYSLMLTGIQIIRKLIISTGSSDVIGSLFLYYIEISIIFQEQ